MDTLINRYDVFESYNYRKSCLTERTIFRPITHISLNDPVDISNEAELPFFSDTNQTGRSALAVNVFLKGLTQNEFDLLKLIASKVFLNNKKFEISAAPISSLLMHIYQKRIIETLFPTATNFMTIGPGSGYLELLLLLNNSNKTIFTTDVNKAFYIFQNYLYSSFGILNETFHLDQCQSNYLDQKLNHIPWWHFKNLNYLKPKFSVDLILCNCAICEMHPLSVMHLLSFAQNYGCPPFLLESTGAQGIQSTLNEVIDIFKKYNYHLKKTKIPDVYLFEFSSEISKVKSFRVLEKIKRLFPFKKELLNEFYRIKYELSLTFWSRFGVNLGEGEYYMPDISKFYEDLTGDDKYKNLDESFLHQIKPKIL